MPRAIEDPILAYTAAEGEINQIQVDTAWSSCSWPAPLPLPHPAPLTPSSSGEPHSLTGSPSATTRTWRYSGSKSAPGENLFHPTGPNPLSLVPHLCISQSPCECLPVSSALGIFNVCTCQLSGRIQMFANILQSLISRNFSWSPLKRLPESGGKLVVGMRKFGARSLEGWHDPLSRTTGLVLSISGSF